MRKIINGIQVPQRADFVGSFLRPADLSDGNRDERVAQLVEKQKELGYTLITDGEFNRTFWHLDFSGDWVARLTKREVMSPSTGKLRGLTMCFLPGNCLHSHIHS